LNAGKLAKSLIVDSNSGRNFLSYHPGDSVFSSLEASLNPESNNLEIDFNISFNKAVEQNLWWALCNQSQEPMSISKFSSRDAVLSVISKINHSWPVSTLIKNVNENSQLHSVFGLSPDLIHELWFGGEVLLYIIPPPVCRV